MLLDIGTVLAGIGLAIVGFIVVIVVCAVILALLAAILPSYEGRTRAEQSEIAAARGADARHDASSDDQTAADPDAPGAGAPTTAEESLPASDSEGDPAP